MLGSLALIGMVLQGVPTQNAQIAPLARQVIDCRRIAAVDARLACYDKATADFETAATRRDIVVLDKGDVNRTRRSLFGFAFPKLPFLSNSGKDVDEGPKEVESSISSVRSEGNDRYVLALADGATWRTIEAIGFTPKVGDKVRIRQAALGSYMMNIDGWRAVRATRIG